MPRPLLLWVGMGTLLKNFLMTSDATPRVFNSFLALSTIISWAHGHAVMPRTSAPTSFLMVTFFPRIAFASAKIFTTSWHFIFVAGVSLLSTYSLFILTSALNAY